MILKCGMSATAPTTESVIEEIDELGEGERSLVARSAMGVVEPIEIGVRKDFVPKQPGGFGER
jgi:hypothetical protein